MTINIVGHFVDVNEMPTQHFKSPTKQLSTLGNLTSFRYIIAEIAELLHQLLCQS